MDSAGDGDGDDGVGADFLSDELLYSSGHFSFFISGFVSFRNNIGVSCYSICICIRSIRLNAIECSRQ